MSRDLMRAPLLGPFLRWRHARITLQTGVLGISALIIADGLFGPQVAPRNLAGVLPWLHWRGLVVLALLVFGNLFCMACPFMLPRRLAKRLLPAQRHWPAALRSKWLAVALLILFFWAYEAFDLWASPWWTAWVALAYFVAAFVVDGFFRGAAFCKYLCPIGQFHFVHSTLSPVEVGVRDPGMCASCHTKDCITGRHDRGIPLPVLAPARPAWNEAYNQASLQGLEPGPKVQSGCETWLFQPRKVGNTDCTFCLDCVHACPHGNVGLLVRRPGAELGLDPIRSGIGRFSQRPDLAFLVLVLVASAFLNAFGMVAPVYDLLDWLGTTLGLAWEPARVAVLMIGGTVVLPLGLVALAAEGSRRVSGRRRTVVQEGTRYVYGLIPLGFGMWLAHYLFHFLMGGLVIVPLARTYLADLGILGMAPTDWSVPPLLPQGWLLPMELFFLELGLLMTLAVLWRMVRADHRNLSRARLAFLPWSGLSLALSAAGIWLLLQPMEMRGTMMGG